MPNNYFHSVTLDKQKCRGCTECLKRCPTQAIRIRDNHAVILNERCIDCGECIRVCSNHAKVALTDPFDVIFSYKYKIALPAPALYAQFKGVHDAKNILAALFKIGFDDVFEVARGAEIISRAIAEQIKDSPKPRPLISSACPAIVRLIQVNFPSLIDNLVDCLAPIDAAARIARAEFCEKSGASPDEVGVFFLTPCAAKVTAIKNPIGQETSCINGAISILDIYARLLPVLKEPVEERYMERAGLCGAGWALAGGEAAAVGIDNSLAVDGIDNVKRVLDEMENNRLHDLLYFEGLACTCGCVGGPLVFENCYVAKNRLRKVLARLPEDVAQSPAMDTAAEDYRMTVPILPNRVMQLEGTMVERLQKMERIEEIFAALPGLDCGSCGSPTCHALAEDIVSGFATELNCIFKLRERLTVLAQQMVSLNDSTRLGPYNHANKKDGN